MSLVEMKGIHKYFQAVHALRDVDFHVGDNEIVGLIGDNGAGKSTLIKILSGLFPPDGGEMYIRGQKIDPKRYSVKRAHSLGIETVFQEQALGDLQPIWRNIFLGRQPTNALGLLDVRKAREEAHYVMTELMRFTGAGMSVDAPVRHLSGGERQGIAIGRAMYFDADLIILDEPTRALSVKEVGKVLDFISRIKEVGKSCVYISHTIIDVYNVSDRFVIMDRGEVVAERAREDASEASLIDLIRNTRT